MDTSIKTTTHDTSSAGFHIADFSSFLTQLTDAVSAAWPDRFATRYRKVKVLLMSWEKDDSDVDAEIRPLESVFRGLYHYDTECWKIPSKRSAFELSRKIADLVDANGQEGNLLILYYGGHARPNENPGGSPVWVANRSRDSPTVQSSILNSLLGEVDADVLLLYDCPDTTQPGRVATGQGVIETLAAGGFESHDAEAGKHSFTASLVQELAHAAHTTDWLSIVELHRRLINRLQAWMPSLSFTDDSYSLVQVDRHTGQPVFEMPRRRTPIYSFLSKKPRTIVLSPLPPQGQKQLEYSLITLSAPTVQPQVVPDGPGILVTCRLRDQNVHVGKWKEWLLNAPDAAKGIQISAIYPGLSAVLILELPLVVWNLLRPSAAISFVAYTTGENHITDFRRALGLDPDELSETEGESEDEDDSSIVKRNKSSGSAKRRTGPRSRKAGRMDRERSSLWPEVFESDRAAVYNMEDETYCLSLAEMQHDDASSMAQKIVRAFAQDVGSPSTRYFCDEIKMFCSTASFEALSGGQEVPELVAMLDERSLTASSSSRMNGMQFLSHNQLYEALSRPKPPPQLIETEPKADHCSPRRRLVYVANLDPVSTLALVSTASENQALFLRDFVYKHITFQSGMDVKFNSSGSQGFQLSFHLPFFAWRQSSKAGFDTRLGGDKRPLRNSRDVSFLNRPGERSHPYIHEAQISCMIVGVDNRHWTAYGFFDTYHDGGESRHDIQSYQPAKGGFIMDPLTGGRHAADSPIWTAREYFLRVMESCVQEVKEEWKNVGQQLLKIMKPYTRNTQDINWGRAQRVSHQTLQVLEQLMQGLSGTIAAWERFQENDLVCFDLDSDDTAAVVKIIENDVQELRVLEETLKGQTEMFKSLTSRLLTLDNNRNTKTTNALITTALAFLPFTLMALISNTPALLLVQPTPTRYIIASAAVACSAAALFLAMMHGRAAAEKVEDLTAYLGGLREQLFSTHDARPQMGGGAWQQKEWWPKAGQGYKSLSEEESAANNDGTSHALPF